VRAKYKSPNKGIKSSNLEEKEEGKDNSLEDTPLQNNMLRGIDQEQREQDSMKSIDNTL
jgi:hypothetical protein